MLLNPIKTLLGFALLGFIAAWMGCADSAPVAPHPAGKAHLTLTCPDSTQTAADSDGDGIPDADSTQTATDSDGDGIPDADSTPTYVTFADSSLERAVRTALGPQVGGDPTSSLTDPTVPPLRVTDLATLTVLNAKNKNIGSLDGLQHATNLDSLWLAMNSISDVSPLRSLTNLRVLRLNVNSISDVTPLASLTNLQRLTLGANSISDVTPLASLTNLQYLRLSGNPDLTNVNSLANLANLDTLKMHSSECKVSDLSDFGLPGKLPSLKLISISGCPLSEASRAAIRALEARPGARRVVASKPVPPDPDLPDRQ